MVVVDVRPRQHFERRGEPAHNQVGPRLVQPEVVKHPGDANGQRREQNDSREHTRGTAHAGCGFGPMSPVLCVDLRHAPIERASIDTPAPTESFLVRS